MSQKDHREFVSKLLSEPANLIQRQVRHKYIVRLLLLLIYLGQSKVLHEHEVKHFWLVWEVLLLSGWIPACDHVTQSSQNNLNVDMLLRDIALIYY